MRKKSQKNSRLLMKKKYFIEKNVDYWNILENTLCSSVSPSLYLTGCIDGFVRGTSPLVFLWAPVWDLCWCFNGGLCCGGCWRLFAVNGELDVCWWWWWWCWCWCCGVWGLFLNKNKKHFKNEISSKISITI